MNERKMFGGSGEQLDQIVLEQEKSAVEVANGSMPQTV